MTPYGTAMLTSRLRPTIGMGQSTVSRVFEGSVTLGLDVLASGGLEDVCTGDSGSPGTTGRPPPAGVTYLHVRLDRDVAVYDLSAAPCRRDAGARRTGAQRLDMDDVRAKIAEEERDG